MPSLPANARIVDEGGRPTRVLLTYLQSIGSGVVVRTTYTYAVIATMTPTLGHTVVCSDSSVVTVGNVLAGGGASVVQAVGDGTNWRVI